MNLIMLKAAFAGLVLSAGGFANAGIITASETTNQTIDGQLFNFSLNINDYLTGSAVS
jgi:hypothetical protein